MSRHIDFDMRSHGLWSWRLSFRQARWRLFSLVLSGCAASGAFLWARLAVPSGAFKAASQYGLANVLASMGPNVNMNVHVEGQTKVLAAHLVADDPWFQSAWMFVRDSLVLGGLTGCVVGMIIIAALRRGMRREGEGVLGDRVIGGTRVVSQSKLARLTQRDADHPIAIGAVQIPSELETRHFAILGTTGSGKTTVLRQHLDQIEARGEAALVYDTSGEFIAHYYRPERGDIILNPFDERCAFWSPFDEIAHPADADRIAHQLVSETGSHDDDVWLETSRILVANMLRALWAEGNGTLEALLDALQMRTKDQLKDWLGETSSARTFADDADRATGSVLFMLAKAANLIQFLRADGSGGTAFAFRRHITGSTLR